MKKIIVEHGTIILDDRNFSAEVLHVIDCKARKREVETRELSCQTQHHVGLCLYFGYRIRKDPNKAFHYLISCLDRGYPDKYPGLGEVAFYVGKMQAEWGLNSDWVFKIAKEWGYPGAKFHYGLALLDDRFETYNFEEGISQIKEASEEGWPPAVEFMRNYGILL